MQYFYTTELGETVERFFPIAKAPKHVTVDGKKAFRDIPAEHALPQQGGRGNLWPLESDAAGCHPDQVDEFNSIAEKHGNSTRWNSGGRAVFQGPRSREHWLRIAKQRDRASYTY